MDRTYYQRHSHDYFERTVKADSGAILQSLVDLVPPPARVLDLGCGSGRDLAWLKTSGYTGFGIEASPELARLARDHCGCPILVADFTTYPLETFEADLIIAVGSLVHIPHWQLERCLQHLLTGLQQHEEKKKGRHAYLYLSFKEGRGSLNATDGRNFHLWQERVLIRHFTQLGMRVVSHQAQASVLDGDDDGGTRWLGYVLRAGPSG